MRGSTLTQPFGAEGGFQQLVRGAPPAAGAEFVLVMDPVYVSRLVACVFTLTTDANAANRYVTVEVEDGDSTGFVVNAAAVTVSASSTQRFAGSVDRTVAEWAANTDVLFPLSRAFIFGGQVLTIEVASIQVGDTLAGIRFLFERFPTAESAVPGDTLAAGG